MDLQLYCAKPRELLEVLRGNHEDAYAVRRVCIELARLMLADPTMRVAVVADEQLLSTLVAAVGDHVDAHDLALADCCRLLRRTICLRAPSELDVQTRITETGILKLLARGLERHPRSPALFTEACRLLTLLCFDMPFAPHAENQTDICDAGLLCAICGRLRDNGVSESEQQHGVDALAAILFENERSTEDAVDNHQLLPLFASLLEQSPRALRLIENIARALFHVLMLQPAAQCEVLALGLLEQVAASLEALARECAPRASLAVWHALKLLELLARRDETAKDALCACGGPLAMLRATQRCGGDKKTPKTAIPKTAAATTPALQLVVCLLFCRLAVVGSEAELEREREPPVPHAQRIAVLVQSGAHEFALTVVKQSVCDGIATVASDALLAQALRLLELLAAIEANRIPLMRLGASRAVKVVYNRPTASPQLQLLCERAVAAIEGT